MASTETFPIKTLNEVWNWRSINDCKTIKLQKRGLETYKISTSQIPQGTIYDLIRTPKHIQSPKVMVCHDMKGGYIEDRFKEGCYNLSEEPYRFIHWALIDTFVYFSHHLITIPPEGWTQAAHKNGVEMLGTIITEFTDGKMICDELLKTKETVNEFVNICCSIAICYGFDGWLLNIENKLDREQVPNMMYLVKKLTEEK